MQQHANQAETLACVGSAMVSASLGNAHVSHLANVWRPGAGVTIHDDELCSGEKMDGRRSFRRPTTRAKLAKSPMSCEVPHLKWDQLENQKLFGSAKKAFQAKIEEPTKCLVSMESLVTRLLGKTHDWPTFRVI